MSKLLRYFSKGHTYFTTIVTYERKEILSAHSELLLSSILKIISKYNANLIAWVILPDHLHLILSPKDNDLSNIVHDLKLSFGSIYRDIHKIKSGRIWQSRFWDHMIRDQDDFNRHIDYIHYNPIKHGLVKDPSSWKYSSFKEFLDMEYYQSDWGIRDDIKFDGEFGE